MTLIPLLTTRDAASMLGVGPRTIHELARHDRIPHRRIPYTKRLLFDPKELRRWLEDPDGLERVDLGGGGRAVKFRD